MSIGIQPYLGIRWYTRLYTGWLVRVLGSNRTSGLGGTCQTPMYTAWVCSNKALIYSIKQGLARVEHHLHAICLRLLNGSKYDLEGPGTVQFD